MNVVEAFIILVTALWLRTRPSSFLRGGTSWGYRYQVVCQIKLADPLYCWIMSGHDTVYVVGVGIMQLGTTLNVPLIASHTKR